jgi:hypothetical protein
MSNSGSRLYLTCRIFPARGTLAITAHQESETAEPTGTFARPLNFYLSI